MNKKELIESVANATGESKKTVGDVLDATIDTAGQIDGQGNRHLIIDLRAMTYIDAAAIAVLVDALKRMEQYGGDLVLSGEWGYTSGCMHSQWALPGLPVLNFSRIQKSPAGVTSGCQPPRRPSAVMLARPANRAGSR